jgi:hypothetical protein
MRRLLLAAALAAALAAPAAADWLVTREGARVETRGVWQVKGKLVVFHTPAGDLSSLRLSEVDLEASRQATQELELARREAAKAARREPERKVPVLVLTDDKVRHVKPGAAPAAPDKTAPSLTIVSWDRAVDPGDGHAVITGTVKNASAVEASDVTVSVQLLGPDGKPMVSGLATLTSTTLPPGQQSGFRAEFPSVTTYADVKFDPSAVASQPSSEAQPQPAAPEPPKKKAAVLTDASFRKAPATPTGSSAPAKSEAVQSAADGAIAVTSWKRVEGSSGGIAIEGTVHNNTDNVVINAAVGVELYDEAGNRVGSASGILSSTSIQPKATIDFRASFPGLFAFSEAKFAAEGWPLEFSPAADRREGERKPPL